MPTLEHATGNARSGGEAPHRTVPRIVVAFGAAGPAIFLGVATLAGIVKRGYDIRTQTLSELALGHLGWIMTANFFLFGVAIIAFAAALFRGLARPSYAATAFLGLAGLGIFASGLFPADMPGTPETPAGAMHNNLFLLLFLALAGAQIATAFALRRESGWRGYTLYTALTPLASFALLIVFIGFGSDPGDPLFAIAGLIQRLLIAVAFGWMTIIGRRLMR